MAKEKLHGEESGIKREKRTALVDGLVKQQLIDVSQQVEVAALALAGLAGAGHVEDDHCSGILNLLYQSTTDI